MAKSESTGRTLPDVSCLLAYSLSVAQNQRGLVFSTIRSGYGYKGAKWVRDRKAETAGVHCVLSVANIDCVIVGLRLCCW